MPLLVYAGYALMGTGGTILVVKVLTDLGYIAVR